MFKKIMTGTLAAAVAASSLAFAAFAADTTKEDVIAAAQAKGLRTDYIEMLKTTLDTDIAKDFTSEEYDHVIAGIENVTAIVEQAAKKANIDVAAATDEQLTEVYKSFSVAEQQAIKSEVAQIAEKTNVVVDVRLTENTLETADVIFVVSAKAEEGKPAPAPVVIAAEKEVDENGKPKVDENGNFVVKETKPVILGDVDASGAVDTEDALAILRNVVGLDEFTATQKAAADVKKDGAIDTEDALVVLQKVVNFIADFDLTGEQTK